MAWKALQWRPQKKSVYFFTFHKCASTLFGDYLLPNVSSLRQVNYANNIYAGEPCEITFRKRGHIYGPLRLTRGVNFTIQTKFIDSVIHPSFIRNKTAVIVVRDPRDYLVSGYYSFGFTHGFSNVEEIRAGQKKIRAEIQSMTIDDYALSYWTQVVDAYGRVASVRAACRKCIVLRYEDMIDDWKIFSDGLTKFIDVEPSVLDELHRRSRPKPTEDLMSHHRSGKTGDFRRKFQTRTITELNTRFEKILQEYGYSIDDGTTQSDLNDASATFAPNT